MIFDRTQNDVDTAIILRREKVQKFQALTESEIATLEKGMLTINTLNRIENKQEELKNLFNEIGYWNTPIANKVWSENDIFSADEFQRILNNTNILRQAFLVYKATPNTPPVSYHYSLRFFAVTYAESFPSHDRLYHPLRSRGSSLR